MPLIEDIINSSISPEVIIDTLKEKTINVPSWNGRYGLINEYESRKHPIMNKAKYPDIISDDGIQLVTRVPLDFQKLAVKRMSELICGIPVKRIFKPENDTQKKVARFIEEIYQRNRIDAVNNERCVLLFASCEVFTLWYATEERTEIYGETSSLKMRCRNFSPMNGDEIYPYFDEYGDLIALSVGYQRKVGKKMVQFFDTYTKDRHIKWSTETGEWAEVENETISLGKIPGIYIYRPEPIWENTSSIVTEMEWALSRNGNYLRENSKPLFVVFADEQISYGDEKSPDKEFRSVMQYPKGSTAQYITWQQAVENLKFYIETLRNIYFTQLQLPDWSYEKMSQQALSGESRKQLFVDAQLKVKDESGRLLEFFDREVNVVKAFAKIALGNKYDKEIDRLKVEIEITPFSITDEKDTITNLMAANGNMPIVSQREAIDILGWSTDTDKTLGEIQAQQQADVFEPTI